MEGERMASLSDSETSLASSNSLQEVRRSIESVRRLFTVFTLLWIIFSGILLILYAVNGAETLQRPFIGAFFVNPELEIEGIDSLSDEPWAARSAGAGRGDTLIGINGTEWGAQDRLASYLATLDTLDIGDRVTLIFRAKTSGVGRCNGPANMENICVTEITLQRMPSLDFAMHFLVSFLVGLALWFLGVFVLIQRFSNTSAKLFSLSTTAFALVGAGVLDTFTTFQYVPFWVLAMVVSAGSLGSLALTFPTDFPSVRRAPLLRYAPFILALSLGVALAVTYRPAFYNIWLVLGMGLLVSSFVVLVYAMARQRRYTTSPILREQATLVGISTTFTSFILLVWALAVVLNVGGGGVFAFNPLAFASSLLYALSMAYVLLQYRLIETDRIVPQATVYTLLVLILTLGFLAITLGLSQWLVNQFNIDAPLLTILTVIIVILAFNPLRARLRVLVDSALFRQRRRYEQRGENFNRALADALSLGQIYEALRHELRETIAPRYQFLFIYDPVLRAYTALPAPNETRPETDVIFPAGSGLEAYLQEEGSVLYLEPGQPLPLTLVRDRARLGVLGTPLFIRIPGRERPRGFLAVGPRRSHEPFAYEDVRYIEHIVEQASLVVERVQFVSDLEQRVRIQDALSQISQALNFAIDFDTLLELLNAQTVRAIPEADHFMLVFYDAVLQEAYFAFYSYGDERLYRLEKLRWPYNRESREIRDVFSEVMRRQQPVRLDDFAIENNPREAPWLAQLPPIKAWMGVPLTTDSPGRVGSVLGVLAVGADDPRFSFSDSQLTLLRDIANIASSAIDKSRLFRQIAQRAEQLRALNEISGQLASQLENVDRLLEFITHSAVNILGCEAGSLLLADDEEADFVFRVVIGGSGADLVGRRISRNQPSLVADAVKRIEPVIVNNPRTDARWHGDVTEETKPKRFESRAILTVPLVAQGAAIGALQVINKRDGTPFTAEDATLAKTFAGQAAIAIQNARLFASQDQQLLMRVQELEGMANIDQSLNRTVILQELVVIIMTWAFRQTRAKHGAFFLLIEEEDMLQMVASFNYPDKTLFEPDRLNTLYPVATGVLGRVVRTGKPTLVSDPHQDPDYVESLPNCTAQIVVPLVRAGKTTGVILVESDQEGGLGLLDLDFMTRMVERASPAVSNALLFNKLEQQQKARSEFVSFIAHELKTPITSMKGYTGLLMRGVVGELNEQQAKFLATVYSNAEHMEHLVNDIRDMEIIDAKGRLPLQMKALNFADVLQDALSTLQQAFESKGQTVQVEMNATLPEIWADPMRINQVLMNFLTNANKYTPEGGQVEIRAEAVENIWDENGARRVLHVAVKDNGYGISEADLKRLFEKYFRSTNDRALAEKGTGLGLTLTRRLIEQHGGTIWVESQLNVGTTFHFTLPLASEVVTERV
jgi:signal transduction histidine kinase